jgi:hypothetical protein
MLCGVPAPRPFNAVKRDHPWGEVGIRSSLDEVAKAASAGAVHPSVRTWSIEMLDLARERGEEVHSAKDRARILLQAVQKKLWVPDPVGAEYIPAAHLLACDPKKSKDGQVCVRGDDCDGKAVLLGAAWSSVGIYTLIVGHAYNEKKQIEHVLCAAYLGNMWFRGDPSTNLPLGRYVPFTRERVLSIPNVKTICDDTVCIGERNFDPEALDFVDKGVFVGVSGPPNLDGLSASVIWETTPRAPTLLEVAAKRF